MSQPYDIERETRRVVQLLRTALDRAGEAVWTDDEQEKADHLSDVEVDIEAALAKAKAIQLVIHDKRRARASQ